MAALVLGIVGILTAPFVLGGLLGIVGLILGIVGIRRAREVQGSGRAMAIIGTVFSVLAIVGASVVVGAGVSLFKSHSNDFNNFTQCMNQATAPAEQRRCAEQFRQNLLSPGP